MVESVWGLQEVRWVEYPRTSQDLIVNELLCKNQLAGDSPVRVPSSEWLLHFGNRLDLEAIPAG